METFRAIDLDQTGLINRNELKVAIKESDVNMTEEQIDRIIDEVDYFGN
jgi:Ca2+-binding EF-hand superfamily protein